MKILDFNFIYETDPRTMMPYLEDLSWLKDVLELKWGEGESFILRCWPGEKDMIKLGETHGEAIRNTQTEELIYQGRPTDELKTALLTDLDQGFLPFFSLSLWKGENCLLNLGHYGAECVLWVEDDQVEEVLESFKDYKVIRDIMVFEEPNRVDFDAVALLEEEMRMLAESLGMDLDRSLEMEGDGDELSH